MTDFFYRQLAKASGRENVVPGESVKINVDLVLAHDGSGPEILRISKENGSSGKKSCRALITFDHSFPAPTPRDRELQMAITDFAQQNDIRLYRNGEGVLHQIVAEEESLWPGMIIVGADGHVATAGAFGAIGFSVSADAFVNTLRTGIHTIEVPEQVVIALEGTIPPTVMARDIAMHLMLICKENIRGKAVILSGTTIDNLSISEKMSICNFLPEGGVVTALILPQGENKQVDISIDASKISPMLSVPGNEVAYKYPKDFASKSISVAIAGGCSAGRLDDMQVIAEVLAKKEVHPDVTFIITPASRNIMESMDKLKISSVLRSAGAVIMSPGCGPCPGKHLGVLCDNDVAITTTIRNTPGRIGAQNAQIYLASPLTVAWSAVSGKITEPV